MFNCQITANYDELSTSKSFKNKKVYVQFYINKKRYRLFNGSQLNIDLSPNSYPIKNRLEVGYLLAEKIFKKIIVGEKPQEKKESISHKSDLEIFKRTGSLTKLQSAMGHSILQVSLTYLHGLEVTELTEDDMPKV